MTALLLATTMAFAALAASTHERTNRIVIINANFSSLKFSVLASQSVAWNCTRRKPRSFGEQLELAAPDVVVLQLAAFLNSSVLLVEILR